MSAHMRPAARPEHQIHGESFTGEQSTASARASDLNRVAWDFSGCADEELDACCFYEHVLECEPVREIVRLWKSHPERQVKDGGADRWFGVPALILADYVGFPDKHWLELDPGIRAQIAKRLSCYSLVSPPAKYAGPSNADFRRMSVPWDGIRRENDALMRSFLTAAGSDSSLRRWPKHLSLFLSKATAKEWCARLSNLSGEELYLTANKLRLECRSIIEKRHRPKLELVVYEVDWRLQPTALVKHFKEWAKATRVHQPRTRSHGHKTTARERLDALGAKRILAFYRSAGTGKVIPAAVAHTSRRPDGTQLPPLYRSPNGWKQAEQAAEEHMKEFL